MDSSEKQEQKYVHFKSFISIKTQLKFFIYIFRLYNEVIISRE